MAILLKCLNLFAHRIPRFWMDSFNLKLEECGWRQMVSHQQVVSSYIMGICTIFINARTNWTEDSELSIWWSRRGNGGADEVREKPRERMGGRQERANTGGMTWHIKRPKWLTRSGQWQSQEMASTSSRQTQKEEKCQMHCEDRFRAGGADYRALRRNHIAYHDQAQKVKGWPPCNELMDLSQKMAKLQRSFFLTQRGLELMVSIDLIVQGIKH